MRDTDADTVTPRYICVHSNANANKWQRDCRCSRRNKFYMPRRRGAKICQLRCQQSNSHSDTATTAATPTAMLQVSIRAEFATQIENLCGTLTIYQQNCWDFPAWQLQRQIIAAKHMQNNKYFKMPPQWHSEYEKFYIGLNNAKHHLGIKNV